MSSVMEISVKKLFVGKFNVRREVGDIAELSASIKEKGVRQPIIVRPAGNRFEIVAGARRFEAAKRAGLQKIPAIVREMTDTEAIIESLIENLQRGDLDVEEEGAAFLTLKNKIGGIREIERQTGISNRRIVETLEAYEALQKLRPAGIKVSARLPSTSEERAAGEALPKHHATELERAFRAETTKILPENVKKEKYTELARIIAPLPQKEAKEVLDHFKMYPERPVEEVKEKALAKRTGIALRTYLPSRVARRLDEVAEDVGRDLEELVPEAVEKFVETYRPPKEPKMIDEIDTGDIWRCPVCKKEFHLIHCRETGKEPSPKDSHKLEEARK